MALPITFANLAAGNQPLSDLDTQFAAVAALGQIPCSASGTNTIVLTPFANMPVISSYPDLAPSFIFAATGTCTGAVTINVNSVGARSAYKWNGPNPFSTNFYPISTDDIVLGGIYRAVPLLALNSGAGGFMVDTIGTSNGLSSIEYVIDGGGSAITTGNKGFLTLPFSCNVLFWSLIADQSGSIELDIWRANNAVPNSGNSIVGSGNNPTLSSAQIATNTAPSGWTSTQLLINDYLAFDVLSATTVTRVTLTLLVSKA